MLPPLSTDKHLFLYCQIFTWLICVVSSGLLWPTFNLQVIMIMTWHSNSNILIIAYETGLAWQHFWVNASPWMVRLRCLYLSLSECSITWLTGRRMWSVCLGQWQMSVLFKITTALVPLTPLVLVHFRYYFREEIHTHTRKHPDR